MNPDERPPAGPDPACVVATELSDANRMKAETAAANSKAWLIRANLTEAHLVEANLSWT